MGCYACAREFGFLTREHGCAKCGFAFCASCLKQRAVIPGKGSKEQKVCATCYRILQAPEQSERFYAPPEALQKRLDRLENPGGTPVIVYKDNKKMTSLRRGLSVEDQKIADRLEKLKRERREKENVPSDADIADRVSKLKGEAGIRKTQTPGTGTAFYKPPDTRKPQEQSRDLLTAMQSEVELDSQQVAPEVDIAMRLAKLRGQDPETVRESFSKPKLPDPKHFLDSGCSNQDIDNEDLQDVSSLIQKMGREVEADAAKAVKDLQSDKDIEQELAKIAQQRKKMQDSSTKKDDPEDSDEASGDEDTKATELAKQILQEQELEERLGLAPEVPKDSENFESVEAGMEELPWCVICNDDAKLRCGGCGDDLYCSSCFKEFHIDEDPADHTAKPFKPK